MLLGLMGEDVTVEEGRAEAVVKRDAGVGFAVLMENVLSGEEAVDLEKRDVYDGEAYETAALMALLALPHSASTSAMMSPPPEMESKVRSEEMSANSELRLVSPGTIGACEVGKSSLDLLTLPSVSVFEGDVVELSCVVRLLVGSELSVSGLSRERGCDLGVSVRSSLMISTLLLRDDINSGLGGMSSFSSFSSLSFERNLTLPKSPLIPRR